MILGDRSHIFIYEQGGSAAIGGIHPRTVPNEPDGKLDLDVVKSVIRSDNIHFPVSRLIVLENTHNRCHGNPLDPDYMNAICELAHSQGLKVHVDGARIFNAAIALNTDVKKLVPKADSVSFCLSKGLAAPIGSMVCGSSSFIAKARRARKILGGGMRQAGIIAAAGIVALNEMVNRLAEDHANAKRLSEGLANISGLSINLKQVKTNIVYIDIVRKDLTAEDLVNRLNSKGVRLLATGHQQLRAVTHYHITSEGIDKALSAFREILE